MDNLQHGRKQLRLGGEEISKGARKRQHPLAHRYPENDVLDQVGHGLAMWREPQAGQTSRRLQENATSFSWAQSPHRKRKNPWAKIPHSRNTSNSSLTNWGRPVPVSCSTWA